MTRVELMERLTTLITVIGDIDHQGCKGVLCLLMSSMEIYTEDLMLSAMLPVQRELVDLAKRAQAEMN